MFLGDGMGDSEITIARNYAKSAPPAGCRWTALPLTGEYTTYAVQKGTPTCPTTSPTRPPRAPAGRPATRPTTTPSRSTPSTLQPLPTILELAQQAGFKTGNVTTAELTDATPAVLDSHISLRGCQGPADMATCPTETKAGRRPRLDRRADRRPQRRRADGRRQGPLRPDGHRRPVRRSRPSIAAGRRRRATPWSPTRPASTAPQPGPEVPRPVRTRATWTWSGPVRSPRRTRTGTRRACTESNPARPAHRAAPVRHDDQGASTCCRRQVEPDDRKGFFLQVEGASIDKQDHAENPCGQIGETVEFDQAIQVALDWAKTHPDTLIIVTADHGHTSQIIEPADGRRPQPGRDRHPDHRRRSADGGQLRHQPRTAARRATPAPRCASRPRARRLPNVRRHHQPDRPVPHDGSCTRGRIVDP